MTIRFNLILVLEDEGDSNNSGNGASEDFQNADRIPLLTSQKNDFSCAVLETKSSSEKPKPPRMNIY